jgi:streptomycin 6-kinase
VVGDLVVVTPEVRDRFVLRFGPEVLAWCDELPTLVQGLADRWDLDLVAAGGGGTSRVFRCRRLGEPVWLKLTPDPVVAVEEAEALTAWAATPAVVGLLDQDLSVGALLLASVEPGVPVKQLPWQVSEAAAMLRDLRTFTPVPDSVLRPLSDRIAFMYDLTSRKLAANCGGVVGSKVLDRARTAALELAASGPTGLVHGDLHPANVLSGPDGRMVAIDPRPAWGDPDIDAVDWVFEGATDLAGLQRRIKTLAALVPGQEADRVLGWSRALAVVLAVAGISAGRDTPETRFQIALARD